MVNFMHMSCNMQGLDQVIKWSNMSGFVVCRGGGWVIITPFTLDVYTLQTSGGSTYGFKEIPLP